MIEQFQEKEGIEKVGFRVHFGQKNSFLKVASLWTPVLGSFLQGEAFVKTVQQTFPASFEMADSLELRISSFYHT